MTFAFLDPRLPDRFWSKVQPCPMTGCWLWTGYCDPQGYGRVSIFGRIAQRTHRVTFTALVGPIADHLEIDHRCRVHACCNPALLDAVTHRVNLLRGIGFAAENAVKQHCDHGHPFDEQNTVVYRRADGRKFRNCRACIKRNSQTDQQDRT